MTIYFFHLHEGEERLSDPDGRDLSGLDEAIEVALSEVRALVGHEALEGRIDMRQRLDVEDGDGMLVHRLCFADAIDILTPPHAPRP